MQDSDENLDWYDAEGNCDEYGCYDAGGHFYMGRADEAADYYHSRIKEMESYYGY